MNKRILHISLFLLLASTSNVLAQQGIGTNTPHRSAALQIDSQNKGLLIPRMNLGYDDLVNKITAPTISIPVKGLLVYNQSNVVNGNSVLVPEGFYYFDGSIWNPISKSYLQNSDHTTIIGDGTAGTPYKVELKPATASQLGGVKIGQNIDVTPDGTISVTFPASTVDTNTTTTVSTDQSYVNVDLTQTVGDATTPINTRDYKIGVDKATANEFGVVKPGAGLSIAENGTLKVDFPTDNNTTYSAGTGITLNGTVFNVPVNVLGGGNVITGVTASTTGLNFSTSQIATTDTMYSAGNGITLTDTQFSVPVTTSSSSDANGNVITNVVQTANGIEITKATIEITDTVTDIQKVATQNYVTITSDPSTPIAGTDRTYTIGVEKATANEFGVVKPGTGLTIDNGTINVSVVDTDNQQLTFNPTSNILTLERGGNPINLSSLAVDNDTKTTVSGTGPIVVTPGTTDTTTNTTNYAVSVNDATAKVGTTAGTSGVVKPGEQFKIEDGGYLSVKYAMPEFFYLPSITIPLNTAAVPQGQTLGTIDLYNYYVQNFNTPSVAGTGNESTTLPVLDRNMLDFYVTYYDNTVINVTSLSQTTNGVLNYTVTNANGATRNSFMNIVVKVRKTQRP